ncbi:MAG: CDP-diacylglycerol--serine O-phosphatidyltransferase [Bacteroidales bacterium]|nr:CDP-diacylglycerol--serine O-phosphatidyltransferase [Bacteroidales bacterium]MDD4209226.1 CDP-diacylglycerol--serine O-phosphatidyltransferase [Bacteroidales bacterium]
MKKNIPNIITLLNLASGIVAIILALHDYLHAAAIMVIVASLFDFCDGLTARLLHVHSLIGKELDSLSDVVSFGVAPAIIMYQLLLKSHDFILPHYGINIPALICPVLFACFAAYRLAKFNLDTLQTENFRGLPTPTAAFVLISFPFFQMNDYSIIIYIITILVLSFLMISTIPLFSLKFKNLKPKDNIFRYIIIFISILLLGCLQFKAIPFIVLIYILLSMIELYLNKRLKKTSE